MNIIVRKNSSGIEGLLDNILSAHMYLFVSGFILVLIGYVFTKLIKRSVGIEIEIDLIIFDIQSGDFLYKEKVWIPIFIFFEK